MNYKKILDDSPNPIFIIKPIVLNDKCVDFEYIYVNYSFSMFLGINIEELVGSTYISKFKFGKQSWFDFFYDIVKYKKNSFKEDLSSSISMRVFLQAYPFEDDMCVVTILNYSKENPTSPFDTSIIQRANYDFLTGFYNRYKLNEIISDKTNLSNVGMVYCDLNNLKQINDLHGHKQGDDYIVFFSTLIKKYFKNDLFFRLGGDEFLVLVYTTNELFQTKVSNFKNYLKTDPICAVGYSFYDKIKNFEKSLLECDKLMYECKFNQKKLEV